MKRLNQIFQAMLGVSALIITALMAAGRLAWRTICKWWKNRSKPLRKVIAIILYMIPIGFIAVVAYDCYDSEYGRCYWKDESLSTNVKVHAFRDSKYRLYNERTGQYTTTRINWVSETAANDSLAVYALPNKRGYVNAKNGEIIIDAMLNNYSKAWVFSEGVAAVMKNGRIGFINAKNEVMIPFHFHYSDKCKMWDFGYLFHNGYCIMTDKEGQLGLIDSTGKWVVEPAYDEIWTPNQNGYRIIVKDGKHGVLDSMCNVVYPAEYGYVNILHDGFVLTKEGKRWQVDFEGNMVQSFMFDSTYYLNYPIGYNESGDIQFAFAEYVKYEMMNRYGIMNRITGEPITPALYSEINMLSDKLFEVQDPEGRDWFIIDTDGNFVSPQ